LACITAHDLARRFEFPLYPGGVDPALICPLVANLSFSGLAREDQHLSQENEQLKKMLGDKELEIGVYEIL